MRGQVGDEIVVDSGVTGGPKRTGEVLEVHRDPPARYVVRWDDGHETLILPGVDARFVRPGRRAPLRSDR
jgi:hypothetical protein